MDDSFVKRVAEKKVGGLLRGSFAHHVSEGSRRWVYGSEQNRHSPTFMDASHSLMDFNSMTVNSQMCLSFSSAVSQKSGLTHPVSQRRGRVDCQ